MRLLFITNQICGSGGLERVLSIKASYLADKMGYEVHFLTLNQYNLPLFYKFSENLIFHDIEVKGRFLWYFYQYKRGLERIINEVNPDIISVCDDGLKGLFVPLYFKKKIPVVYERHTVKQIFKDINGLGIFSLIKYRIHSRLADLGSKLFDRFVVLTRQNAEEWPKADAVVIPNPISFYTQEPALLENKRVISVGTMSHVKGFDLLLRAWQLVTHEHPDWVLDIYGKTTLKKELIQLAKELNIEDKVYLNEPVFAIEEKYKSSSIYVLSSRFEGFGMVLIEAMACGLPCVSFDCPLGPADIVSHGVDGFLVEPSDILMLSEKIKFLIENQSQRKKMGDEARKNARLYLPEVIVPKWHKLFKELTSSYPA